MGDASLLSAGLHVPPEMLALLGLAALIAGTIDAIAGGGGLISVPALLLTGWPTPLVLGTNKGQSVWGSSAALYQYWRAGAVQLRDARWPFAAGMIGAFAGAQLVLLVHPTVLRPVVLVLLVGAAVLLTLRPMPKEIAPLTDESTRIHRATLIALLIGAYDGFFGPGTGTFLILAATYWLGRTAQQATAEAKVVNVASNLASLSVFAVQGVVVWRVALVMAVGQLVGGTLGSRLAVQKGPTIIRPLVLLVTIALALKMTWDLTR